MSNIDKKGYLVVKDFLTKDETAKCIKLIKDSIVKAAQEINVETKDYLSCTGRWASNSPITLPISSILEARVKEYLENLLESKITLKKSNVICKTCDITDSIAFHQDISYSDKDPYHFSMWLSFNDVDERSAPLEIIENSHKKEIEQAVDFWSPHFIDKYRNNLGLAQKILVKAGDAILFDSKLWHGSSENYSKKDRFAYVTRWVIEGKNFPIIPPIKKESFGMFNCGELTVQILEDGLYSYTKKQSNIKYNREEIISQWISILTNNNNILGINSYNAINDLKRLGILNKACDLHHAGNISGQVYKNLWNSMLSILNEQVRLVKN